MSRVQGITEHGQITNPLQRERRAPHALEMAGPECKAGLIERWIVVAIAVQLRRLGCDYRWGGDWLSLRWFRTWCGNTLHGRLCAERALGLCLFAAHNRAQQD
jgi:hypothetical protein